MKTAPIAELTESVKTWNPSREPDSEFGYIDLGAVDNERKIVTGAAPTIGAEAPSRARQLVAAGDVLVSTVRPNLNAVAVVSPDLDGATASTGFTVLRPTPELDGRFLFHWVRSPDFISDMVRRATGASYPAVSDRIVKSSRIPAPPLEEQRRIAAILDCADAVCAKRRQILAYLDALRQAIFHDMFGHDPGQIRELGEVAHFFGGASLPAGEPFTGQEAGTLLMKVSDMNAPGNEDVVFSTALWSPGDGARSATVGSGAVVLPKRGASIATNKKRLTTRKTSLDPNLMGVQPRAEWITSTYLLQWFRTFDLAGITSGSTVPQLNKQDLSPLRLPVPSLVRQAELEQRLSAVASVMAHTQTARARDDDLFVSLRFRAFRGEL